jgi:hypothetical protein
MESLGGLNDVSEKDEMKDEKVVIPTLVVSGFFPEKQAQSIMEELENQ